VIGLKCFGEVLTSRESAAGKLGQSAGKGLVEVTHFGFHIAWQWRRFGEVLADHHGRVAVRERR
jgi:hypothetical protein